MLLSRRGLLGSLLAAPAVVAARNIMPVKKPSIWIGLPTFTGTPIAPTPANYNTTRIATTQFVHDQILIMNYEKIMKEHATLAENARREDQQFLFHLEDVLPKWYNTEVALKRIHSEKGNA